MLRFTREAEYGLLAMTYIATRPDGELAYRREIAEHHNIPREFLAKVLQKLSRRGLIKSYRGIRGGYLLARVPAEISIADVVCAVDGPLALVECARPDGTCPQDEICGVRNVLWGLQDEILGMLKRVTVKDLSVHSREKPGDLVTLPAAGARRKPRTEGSV
ncbi:MAG TPA: Rrf2 family transcriptional regulator [Candidatus Dormibacteraeota bacterium]|nr:Rrf2 family transcriptional regulator [Candidatus Dormibacteraeota bacterium]